jgi:group I intron endonuclease
MIIYKITNKINGKCYVGQTIHPLELRWKQHCQHNRKRPCPVLLDAIKKYGKDNFEIETIEKCSSRKHMNEREKHWIALYGSFGGGGYNLTSGGDRVELAEESRQKISAKLKGRPTGRKGLPSNQKIWNKGIPWSDEMKKKLSKAHLGQVAWCKGKKMSAAARKNMSMARAGKPNPSKCKPIVCTDTGTIYPSATYAATILGLSNAKICLVLKGRRNHTGGLKFKYL